MTQDLQVLKVKDAAGSTCYVLTLNRSDNALPEAVLNLNASAPVRIGLYHLYCSVDCHDSPTDRQQLDAADRRRCIQLIVDDQDRRSLRRAKIR